MAREYSAIDSRSPELAYVTKGGFDFDGNIQLPEYLSANQRIAIETAGRDPAADVLGAVSLSQLSRGGWTWFNEPRAICYGRKMYVGDLMEKTAGDVGITSFDLDTGARNSFLLATNLVDGGDDHDNPAIVIRPDGRLIAIYSTHGGADNVIRYRISTNPEDVTAWGVEQTIAVTNGTSYANAFKLANEANRIYLFHRADMPPDTRHKPQVRWSDDSGVTWTARLPLFIGQAEQRPYVRYTSDGLGRIHFLASSGHPRSSNETPAGTCHMFHWYMEGGSFYRTDGTYIRSVASLGTTGALTEAEVTKIYDATVDRTSGADGNAWGHSIAIGPGGRPYVTFSAFNAAGDNRYWYARWTGASWEKREILAGQGTIASDGVEQQYVGLCVVDPRNTNRLWVSKQTGVSAVWEIERWTTPNGGAQWEVVPITVASGEKNIRPYVPYNWVAGAPSVMWTAGAYTNFLDYSLRTKALSPSVVFPDSFTVTDTFTAADSTLVTSRAADTGQSWIGHPASVTGAVITGNRMRGPDGAAGAHEIIVPGPIGRRLKLTGDIVQITDNNSAAIGPTALQDPFTLNYLHVRRNTSTDLWEAFKFIDGTATSLGTFATAAGSYEWLIDETGFTFAIAGIVRITAAASTYKEIAAPGGVGVRATGTHGAAVGVHLDNFHVEVLP